MHRSGYSLIEVLVVIAIIGILVGIGTYSFGAAGARSRDSTRKIDLEMVRGALQQYYLANRTYPSGTRAHIYELRCQIGTFATNISNTEHIEPKYIQKLPVDPKAARFDNCSAVIPRGTVSQFNHLLYISGSDSRDPIETRFSLLARLERLNPDIRIEKTFKVDLSSTYFNQNYKITGQFGR